jgi:hypothetical protein
VFLDAIAEAGLFANLRIGPYVCAEWDYGGIPVWLSFKEGIKMRSYNQVWRQEVQKWVGTVIDQITQPLRTARIPAPNAISRRCLLTALLCMFRRGNTLPTEVRAGGARRYMQFRTALSLTYVLLSVW